MAAGTRIPVAMIPEILERLANIIEARGINETTKADSLEKIAKRIVLFHEILERGLKEIENDTDDNRLHAEAEKARLR